MVEIGSRVTAGQTLVVDRRNDGIRLAAPVSGTLSAILRGERRAIQAVVIDHDPVSQEPEIPRPDGAIEDWSATAVRELLQAGGAWSTLRQRPFDIPIPINAPAPAAIFVTAIDTRPLAADPALVLGSRHEDLRAGLRALARLAPVHLCLGDERLAVCASDCAGVSSHVFSGPHPAGLVGLHIHRLQPVDRQGPVWHCLAQDAAAIGQLCRSGQVDSLRTVAIAGPGVNRPRLLRLPLGAALAPVVGPCLLDGDHRIISGSILDGRLVEDLDQAFLGRFHHQVCVMPRGADTRITGVLMHGSRRFSIARTLSAWLSWRRRWPLNAATYGQQRSVFPSELFDQVFPFADIPIVPLLRAIQARDIETAERLGALELCPEDLALATFVDPCKIDHAQDLGHLLDLIREEG